MHHCPSIQGQLHKGKVQYMSLKHWLSTRSGLFWPFVVTRKAGSFLLTHPDFLRQRLGSMLGWHWMVYTCSSRNHLDSHAGCWIEIESSRGYEKCTPWCLALDRNWPFGHCGTKTQIWNTTSQQISRAPWRPWPIQFGQGDPVNHWLSHMVQGWNLLWSCRRLFNYAHQRDLWSSVNVIFVPSQDESHWTHHVQEDFSRYGATVGRNLRERKRGDNDNENFSGNNYLMRRSLTWHS